MSRGCDRPEHSETGYFRRRRGHANAPCVSSLIPTWGGRTDIRNQPIAQVLNLVQVGWVVAVMSEATFAELEEVLHRRASSHKLFHACFLCGLLQIFVERGQREACS